MIRLLSKIFHWEFEPCKGCEVLSQQLAIANAEKKELTNTLLAMLNPKVTELAPTHTDQIRPQLGLFARRRAELERKDRDEARMKQASSFVAKPDEVAVLETEVGVG